MKAKKILWDTDGDKKLFRTLPQTVELPKKFSRENYTENGEFDEDTLVEDISDWLTDEYGFCHDGFDIVW